MNKDSTFEYSLGIVDNDEFIAEREMKSLVRDLLKDGSMKIKVKYKKYGGSAEGNHYFTFSISGPKKLADKLKEHLNIY